MWWRTGNDTWNPQWVYIGIHIYLLFGFIPLPNPLLFKWGIGGSWLNRLKGVSGTIPGFVLPIFLVYIPFAYQVEQWGHRQLSFINVPYFGSGRTEWFFIAGLAFAVPVLALVACIIYVGLFYAGCWALDREIVAQNALKWVAIHPLATAYLVAAFKVAVIAGQVVMYRERGNRRGFARFAGKA